MRWRRGLGARLYRGLGSGLHSPSLQWDRFAGWPKWPARLVLALVLALVVAATLVPIHARVRHRQPNHDAAAHAASGKPKSVVHPPGWIERGHDTDLALYDRIIARIQHGERYYDFIADELRRSRYPVTPAFAVRLPTLAYAEAALGPTGCLVAVVLLFLAVLLAWRRRLGDERIGRWHRLAAMALLAWLSMRAVSPYYLVMHELWAGLLLALAAGLHRPGRRWVAALVVTALAVAVRELVVPFVLLMGALAFWRRDWKEGLGWTGLLAAFVAVMVVHFQLVAPHVLPSDKPSASWWALRGLSGWFSDVILPSNLRYFDYRISAVLVVLTMLGWAGWRSDTGRLGFLFLGGYAVMFMIAGRWENFYWGWLIAPTLMVGLAFAPRALLSLTRAAFPGWKGIAAS
jgi:hypothetical protein